VIRQLPRVPRLAAALVAVAASVLAACGIPLDEAPEVVSSPTSSGSAAPTTTLADGASAEVAVYFLRGDRLEAQSYPVAGSPQLRDALGFVLARPAEGSDPELRTSVPPGTTLRRVQVAGDVASIDLSSDIDDVSGLAQKEAFAQMVFTALAFTDVQQVRFLVEGRTIDAPTDDGNLSLISADNYDKPLNPR
jgi:spore germination protein GerM